MVYPRKVLHITVNAEGQISLWDTREQAMAGKEKHDVRVELLLTLEQTEQIKLARDKARNRARKT